MHNFVLFQIYIFNENGTKIAITPPISVEIIHRFNCNLLAIGQNTYINLILFYLTLPGDTKKKENGIKIIIRSLSCRISPNSILTC